MPDTPPQPGQLVINTQSDDVRHITIRPAGELDLVTVVRLEDVLRRVENDHGGAIVLDLSCVTFIDSTGVSTLVRAWRRSHANGDRLRMRGATGQVERVLQLTGLYERFMDCSDRSVTASVGPG